MKKVEYLVVKRNCNGKFESERIYNHKRDAVKYYKRLLKLNEMRSVEVKWFLVFVKCKNKIYKKTLGISKGGKNYAKKIQD